MACRFCRLVNSRSDVQLRKFCELVLVLFRHPWLLLLLSDSEFINSSMLDTAEISESDGEFEREFVFTGRLVLDRNSDESNVVVLPPVLSLKIKLDDNYIKGVNWQHTVNFCPPRSSEIKNWKIMPCKIEFKVWTVAHWWAVCDK